MVHTITLSPTGPRLNPLLAQSAYAYSGAQTIIRSPEPFSFFVGSSKACCLFFAASCLLPFWKPLRGSWKPNHIHSVTPTISLRPPPQPCPLPLGRLGTGDTLDRASPVQVIAPNDKAVDAVSLGQFHSAILADGELFMFGRSDHCQLGPTLPLP